METEFKTDISTKIVRKEERLNEGKVNLQLEDIKPQKVILKYDKEKWHEIISQPAQTLQVFITNKCNKRCLGCFYEESLGKDEITVQEYEKIIEKYENRVSKVILLGGEPTIHKNFKKLIEFNNYKKLKTTIYTNGYNLKEIENLVNNTNEKIKNVDVRIGVLGLKRGEKNLAEIAKTTLPVTIVYMLRQNNIDELIPTAEYAEKNFNCKEFYISSIRDIAATQSFWKDTKDTLTMGEYSKIVQEFIDTYQGNISKIHISRRGILTTNKIISGEYPIIDSCRFTNIFPDKKKIICPFDISKKIYTTNSYDFNSRKCNKNDECLLQKIVLERN